MQRNDHLQQRYGSIDPSTICMGPKAIRSGTSSTQKVISDELNSLQTQQTHNISSTNEGVTKGLTQPRHKLPLKMILSEVARRGDYSHAAVIPTSNGQSKSAYTSVDAILANPTLMDNKRNRPELLAHPNYLGKKRSKIYPYDVMYPLRKLTEVNSYSNSVQEKQRATTAGCRSSYDNEEDPFILSKDICTNRANRLTLDSNYLSGTIQAEDKNVQNPETNRKNLHEDKCANNYNNLTYTPFAKLRFQNLYGNNFLRDNGGTGTKLNKSNLAHIQEVGLPIYEMQAWCKEKTYAVNDPYVNSRAPPDNERLTEAPDENTRKFEKSTTSKDKCTQNSFLSTQCFFLPQVFGESERDNNDDFVWNPQIVECKSENEISRSATRQSILKTSRSCLKSKVHFSSQPREENTEEHLTSNYCYKLSEYSITIDSQNK